MRIYTFETQAGYLAARFPDELQKILKSAGSNVTLEFKTVEDNSRLALSILKGKPDLQTLIIRNRLNDPRLCRLVIATDRTARCYKSNTDKLKHALWGSSNGPIAIDCAPSHARLYNQVHECLHLFGVDDCYDEKSLEPKPTCRNGDCVMRYGRPTLEVCEDVVSQLRRCEDLFPRS